MGAVKIKHQQKEPEVSRVIGALTDRPCVWNWHRIVPIFWSGVLNVKQTRLALVVAAFATFTAAILPRVAAEEDRSPRIALMIAIDGPIGPATARHVKEGLG